MAACCIARFFGLGAPRLPCSERRKNFYGAGKQLAASNRSAQPITVTRPLCKALEGAATVALVRNVANSMPQCITMEPTSAAHPIDVGRARLQHAAYVDVLRGLVPSVVIVQQDDAHPDCCFIEDTAVVIGRRALITRPGAPARRGECPPVESALRSIGIEAIHAAAAPALIDGGDVLCLGGCIFVGQSRRTNREGVLALQEAFPGVKVVPVPVAEGLHLKSVLSWAGGPTLLVEDSVHALKMYEVIMQHLPSCERVLVPTSCAANAVFVSETVLYPGGMGQATDEVYNSLRFPAIPIDISEFQKADGGLTCLSILVR
eukprot:jgi/Mesvir1/14216/Mv09667-RA.1